MTATDVTDDIACNWFPVLTTSASDFSGFSCRPFCIQSDVSDTHSDNGQCSSYADRVHCQMKLSVISILVIPYPVSASRVRAAVDGEQY